MKSLTAKDLPSVILSGPGNGCAKLLSAPLTGGEGGPCYVSVMIFFNLSSCAGPVESKPEAAMSELVPESRQKPVVPMKPMGINTNLLGYIGIDTIIEQMRKKTMKTGFDFNIMVVGRQGPAEVLETMARDYPVRSDGKSLQGGHKETDSSCSGGKESLYKARRHLQPLSLSG